MNKDVKSQLCQGSERSRREQKTQPDENCDAIKKAIQPLLRSKVIKKLEESSKKSHPNFDIKIEQESLVHQIKSLIIELGYKNQIVNMLLEHRELKHRSQMRSAWLLEQDPNHELQSVKLEWAKTLYDWVSKLAISTQPPKTHTLLMDPSELLNLIRKKTRVMNHFSQDVISKRKQVIDPVHFSHINCLESLSLKFAELHPRHMQVGVDESSEDGVRFLQRRIDVGNRILKNDCRLQARQYLKFGTPIATRISIWKLALGLKRDANINYSNCGKRMTRQHESPNAVPLDKELKQSLDTEIFQNEIKKIGDDPVFFPFEDKIKRVVRAFLSDESISGKTVISYLDLHRVHFPQKDHDRFQSKSCCGIIGIYPFPSLIRLIAPLLIIFDDEEDALRISRELFIRYWSVLGSIDSRLDGTVRLFKLFEVLLLWNNCDLYIHLCSIKVNPLDDVAISWICSAFTTLLDVEETLNLWDRIIGFDDLRILSVVAVSIFMFHSETLMGASNLQEVKQILSGKQLKVIPLLQCFLFQDTFQ